MKWKIQVDNNFNLRRFLNDQLRVIKGERKKKRKMMKQENEKDDLYKEPIHRLMVGIDCAVSILVSTFAPY